ncbi:hypothetical protein QBC35DRAFT_468219 [Podospora australis]|uniref:Heterokaryon incompatibility domain-containing protein n=1 Tax=Podospora australis TaxID=1536484 RepID=A0AAN7AD83_9PEZI|nr:hypothetical protein QBC35DRAFT_468219 [Podospora australis]
MTEPDDGDCVAFLAINGENISEHCRGIPLAIIPATFRNAIIVARHLRIPYIWIDSLCIVQDDRDDWNAESARMGGVYEYAFATLFAERSRNCADGLFPTDLDLNIARERFPSF